MTATPASLPARTNVTTTSSPRSRSRIGQIASFGTVGAISTAAYIGLFAALRNIAPAASANVIALLTTAVGNTAANRRLTFDIRGRDGLVRHHLAGLIALLVALVITSGAIAALDEIAPHRGRLTEIAVLVAANAAATLVRFLLLRLVIDQAGRNRAPAAEITPAFATLSTSEGTPG
jgi:putative flippase GtrA